ncbi:MAG: hypothetical protein IPK80_01295 [Nannocystis sp.]|nr:hypothetical protein [Nannocystis sp.]
MPGSIYKIGARHYVDSQALALLADAYELVPQAGGWRVLAGRGAVHCALVEGRPELPRQRGALYEIHAAGGADLKAEGAKWLAAGHVAPAREVRAVARVGQGRLWRLHLRLRSCRLRHHPEHAEATR